jgi:SAM-dependent methyltransferase
VDRFCFALARAAADALVFEEPIVEVASRIVAGQEAVSNLRGFFEGKRYVGGDLEPGPGVDRTLDLTRLDLRDGEAGSFISLNTLEHVWDVFAAGREIERVLRPGGVLLVSTVFNFYIHEFPADYWRMTPAAVRRLFPGCRWFIAGQQGAETTPRITFGLGIRGEEGGALATWDTARLEDLGERLEREGREPVAPGEWLRARVGYHLVKKRAFRDFVHFDEVRLRLFEGERVVAEAGWER